MKQFLLHVAKFRALFVVLGVAGLLLAVVSLSGEGAASLITWEPYPVEEGDVVTFSTIDSYDVYEWWRSDGPGSICDITSENSAVSTASTYEYTFYQTGDWQVCLRVPDGAGGYLIDRQTVTVNNLPPTIDDPSWWTISAEPSVAGAPFHVEVPFTDFEDTGYTCTIDYGDGTGEEDGTITGPVDGIWTCVGPDHTYTTASQYDVRATITDIQGAAPESYSYYYHTVTAPEHLFSWDPLEPTEGGTAYFTAVGGYYNHSWSRGYQPGETCSISVNYSSATTISFETSGDYQVCLSMYDEATDQFVTESQWVTVTNHAPWSIEPNVYPQPSFPGMEVTMYGYFTDYGDAPYIIEVDWGDGSAHETFVVNDTSINGRNHTYAAVGEYSIQVSVTDKDSATGTGTTTQDVTTVMVAPEDGWLASNTQPTTIELLGAGIGTESMSFSIASAPKYGLLGTPSAAVCQPFDMPGVPVDNLVSCKATVVYTPFAPVDPLPPYIGEDSFTFTMSDGTTTSPEGTINLWVGPNGAPTAQAGSATVSTVTPGYIVLTATDPDIYEYNYNSIYDRITFSIDSQPANGTLGPLGTPNCVPSMDPTTENFIRECTSAVLYTPNPGTTATADSFTFHVNDTHQDSATATVSLTLRAPVTLHVNAVDDVDDGTCDETHCNLREAVQAAWSGDIIDFTLSLPNTIVLAGSKILINKDITISGPGADQLAISGGALPADGNDGTHDRVFEFYNYYQPMNASISGLTIKDGRSDKGGGIYIGERADVTVTDCVIGPNNIVTYAGGGIANEYGTLTLNRSTVVENHGTGTLGGAGIVTAWTGSTTTLINSTVTGNVTNNYGGGILAAYGGRVNLIQSTVSGNLANENYLSEPWGGGGGIAIIGDGMVSIQNSIVAGNTDETDPVSENHEKWTDVSGAFSSLGGNLIGDGTGSTGWGATDLVGIATEPIDAMLDPLALNDPGKTPTFALLEGSPAIDAVSCIADVDVDQRGVTRPQGSACDIGAFELEQTVVDTTPPVVTVPEDVTYAAFGPEGVSVSFTATALDDFDGVLTPNCTPASGSLFPIGTTTVTCTAIDAAGNIGSNSFTVTVVQSMYVSTINLSNKPGRTNTITGLVTIRNYLGALLSKAAVTIEWHLPSGLAMTKTVSTDRYGVAKFVLRGMPAGTYELCVINVAKSGWIFVPGANDCKTIAVP